MSPFTQLNSAFGTARGGVDRNFSPAINFLDEFDRHFSHHHRFMNCYIPRFDLEEDAQFYYLYGEVPGTRTEDISVEAHDDHTLVISGTTRRLGSIHSPAHEYVKVDVPVSGIHNGEYFENDGAYAGKAAVGQYPGPYETSPNATQPGASTTDTGNLAPAHPEERQHSREREHSKERQPHHPLQRRTLLSERLVGDFSRTFAFPTPIDEGTTRASVENGLLCLVVPKREQAKKMGRKIPILGGSWGSGGGQKVA